MRQRPTGGRFSILAVLRRGHRTNIIATSMPLALVAESEAFQISGITYEAGHLDRIDA